MTEIDIAPKKNLEVELNSTRLRSAGYDPGTENLIVSAGRLTKAILRRGNAGVYNNLITAQKPDFTTSIT